MTGTSETAANPDSYEPAAKQKAQAKTARLPIKVVAAPTLPKPPGSV